MYATILEALVLDGLTGKLCKFASLGAVSTLRITTYVVQQDTQLLLDYICNIAR
jgi:hypothetical protein